MNTLLKAMRNFWSERNAREQHVLAGGAAVLAALAFYFVLLDPALSGTRRLQRQMPETRARAAQLEAMVAEAKSLRTLPAIAAGAGADGRARLEASVQTAGLPAPHILTLPNGDLRMTFTGAPYAKWSGWLFEVERTLGARAVAVKAKAAAPGNADIDLTLRPAHG